MSTPTDPLQRDRWARLRFSIIGPLLAAPPAPGDLHEALAVLAAQSWRHPLSGLDVRFGLSTIERWYYAARSAPDPVAILRNRLRPRGRFVSLAPVVIDTLVRQYREHPGWTAQLHFDNLRAALANSDETVPSCPTVRRYLKAQGMFRQARPRRTTDGALRARDRLVQREVRSFELDHVSALWHLDFHHGARRVLTRAGTWEKPFLLGIVDDRSRLVCHLQWYLEETARSLIHGLSQAFMKRGLPRALMTDNGAAMLADETVSGLNRLGVLHQTTLPYSPYQNAKQESFRGRIEGRLMPMLEGEPALTLALLNQATQAWVEQSYHRTLHSELGTSPLERYLAGPNVRRECPAAPVLADAFRIEVPRRQRRSDGTVTVQGQRFEIPSRYHHLAVVSLRYARWDLTRVDLVDPHTGAVLCPITPLDKSANANAERRRRTPAAIDLSPLPPAGMRAATAPVARRLRRHRPAAGLPDHTRHRQGPHMNAKLLALYGLKWHPFTTEVPTEAIHLPARVEHFCWRIEQGLIREGGFAMIHGDPGTGKSVALRLLAERLARLPDVTVGAIAHPQSNLADFYREMGELFGVPLRPHNRWGGFKALREVWAAHLETTRRRPVLLIDEAQEMSPAVLSELRLMASAKFDSQSLLCVVLAGDARLPEKLRREELIPLGSRIRTRIATESAGCEELLACLQHLTSAAGNASLMSAALMHTLCEHAVGNYRILTTMAAELLAVAAHRDLPQLDEKLYLEVFAPPDTIATRRPAARH